MTISLTESQNIFSKISIPSDQMPMSQNLLAKLGFELNELWQKDDCPETHIWRNPKTGEIISIKQEIDFEASQSLNKTDDATTKGDLLVEVIDLWFELRAIRDILAADNEIPLVETLEEESVHDRFFEAVDTVKNQCGDFEGNIKELFDVQIDIETLAFLSLTSSDKSLLCN